MATQPIAPPMTVDEFVRVYGDDNRFELIDGEVCGRQANGFTHYIIENRIKDLFGAARIAEPGYLCLVELSFRLTGRAGVIPDVCLIRKDRLRHLTGNAITSGSPDIPIEVSISDSASVLERKVTSYLANGAHAVCVVYPDLRSVVIYRGVERRRLTESDALEFPEVLPGLSIPVAAIFEEL
jgi:Uma2 family endonuclease